MIFIAVFLLVLLGFCWFSSEVGLGAKLVLTLLYIAHWFLLYWTIAAVIIAQVFLIIVTATMTFGADFLTRRR